MAIWNRFWRAIPARGSGAGEAAARSKVIALAGNPNTGKSTVFNALTGLRQHTGNWPGKTVLRAEGRFSHRGLVLTLVDLPGTYSLLAGSADEQVARDFICFGRPDATAVVVDATCLERNLNLALQILEITPHVVVCLNLMDEAERKGICVDVAGLSYELGVPVVAAAARSGRGIAELKDAICRVATGAARLVPRPVAYAPEVEQAVNQAADAIAPLLPPGLSPRWVALRLLAGDGGVKQRLAAWQRQAGLTIIREGWAAPCPTP